MLQRAVPLGFLNLSSLSSAVSPTLPVGALAASASACNLSGSLLTLGGVIHGNFAIGQTVVGTGIPPNTIIVQAGTKGTNSWWLSNSVTNGSGILVQAYVTPIVDFALIRASGGAVNWRDDGIAPTGVSGGGFPMLTTDPPLEYRGDLSLLQFIQQTGNTSSVQIVFYSTSG